VFAGLEAGRADVEHDRDITVRWVPDVAGEAGPEAGELILAAVLAHGPSSVIEFSVGGLRSTAINSRVPARPGCTACPTPERPEALIGSGRPFAHWAPAESAAAFALAGRVTHVTGVDQRQDMLYSFSATAQAGASGTAPRWPDVAPEAGTAAVVVSHHVLHNVVKLPPFVQGPDGGGPAGRRRGDDDAAPDRFARPALGKVSRPAAPAVGHHG
jgi:hypothetical protein